MKQRFHRRILYTLLIFLDSIFLLIPYNLALTFGRCCGWFAYVILPKYRRLAKRHIKFAFDSRISDPEITRITRDVFKNIGMGLAEVLSLPKIKGRLSDMIDIEGLQKIDDVLKEGKGVIVITGHIGNWELLPMYFAYRGYSANVVARPVYYHKFNEWISFLRSSMGVNVIFRTDSPKRILRLLKENKIVGVVADQDVDSIEGVFIDFFNHKAYTPSAPVKIAMATGTPIVPMVIIRNKNRHKIIVGDPIRVGSDKDNEAAVVEYTQRWSDILESYIRRYPEQWVWMHRRWKTQAS